MIWLVGWGGNEQLVGDFCFWGFGCDAYLALAEAELVLDLSAWHPGVPRGPLMSPSPAAS